jgi:glycosyltransferase involved in cell wall biosynthesis
MATLGHVEIGCAFTRADSSGRAKRRVAIFISADSFEHFFGGMFGINRERYLRSYRNDFVWDYASGLRDEGHEIFIYILSYGPAELREVENHISVRFIPLPAWLRTVDPLLYRLRGIPHFDMLRERIRFKAYGPSLQRALRADGIRVLYHQEIWTPRFTVIVPRVAIPVIGADHGACPPRTVMSAHCRSFRLAALLSCQSLEGLERARRMGGNAVLMCNGVDTTSFAPSATLEPRRMNVLTVGRMVESQKRFSDLIHAMRILPEFTLTIVGTGPDEGKLKRLPAELGISDRVHFAGFVSDREQLRRLYQQCGVFVSSSAWEATALVVLEAMSCGAPVVATKIPSFEDLFTDGKDGLLIPIGQPEEIACAVRRAYRLQRDLGHEARQTVVRRYSSKALYRSLSDLIQTVSADA